MIMRICCAGAVALGLFAFDATAPASAQRLTAEERREIILARRDARRDIILERRQQMIERRRQIIERRREIHQLRVERIRQARAVQRERMAALREASDTPVPAVETANVPATAVEPAVAAVSDAEPDVAAVSDAEPDVAAVSDAAPTASSTPTGTSAPTRSSPTPVDTQSYAGRSALDPTAFSCRRANAGPRGCAVASPSR